jgi:hypothetical protein
MAFAIKSARSDAELAFVAFEGGHFTVEFRSSEVSAVLRVWGYTDCQFLVDLLQHLAQQKRGWKDPMEWQSIESDLALQFRSDSHGHVFVAVEMRHSHGEEDWLVKAGIQTELGQLPHIAANAAAFFQSR